MEFLQTNTWNSNNIIIKLETRCWEYFTPKNARTQCWSSQKNKNRRSELVQEQVFLTWWSAKLSLFSTHKVKFSSETTINSISTLLPFKKILLKKIKKRAALEKASESRSITLQNPNNKKLLLRNFNLALRMR